MKYIFILLKHIVFGFIYLLVHLIAMAWNFQFYKTSYKDFLREYTPFDDDDDFDGYYGP